MSDEDDDIEPEPDDFEADLGPDAEIDEEELDEEDLGELEDEDLVDDELVGDDLDETPIDEEEDAVIEPPRPRARTADDKEDDDEDLEESDDVEADLDTILKDRLATHDEDEDEDEDEAPVVSTEDGDLPQRREFEFPCPSCFLLVNAKQVNRTGTCPQCGDPIQVPVGLG